MTAETVAYPAKPATGAPAEGQTAAQPGALSRDLVDEIHRLLDAEGIFHGTLTEGPPNLNHNLSDRSHVFVKVSRLGELTDRPFVEVRGARLAKQCGIAAPAALLDEPRVLALAGDERAVTVWSYFDGCTPPALRDRVAAILELLADLSAAPVPATPAVDVAWFAQRVESRLVGLVDVTSLRIRAQAREGFARVLAALDQNRFTWVHGDAHLRNVLWGADGRPVLVDWESHGRCIVEWEIAPLLRSVFVDTPTYSPDERLAVARLLVARATALFAPDWALVVAALRARNASAESHLHLLGHDPTALAACYTLDTLTVDEDRFLASIGA